MSATALSQEECFTIASRQLGTSQVQVLDVRVAPIGSGVTGFMGDHLHINISVVECRTKQHHDLHFFVKAVPTAVKDHVEYVLSLGAYQKETMAYSTILPALQSNLESGERWFSNSYLTKPDLIVLENLATQGYRLHDNLKPMDYAHVTLVLQNLAKMHAASIIFEERNRPLSDMYKDVLYENLFSSIEGNSSRSWFLTGVKAALFVTEYLPTFGKDSEFYYFIKQKLPDTCKQIWDLVKPSTKYRNVLCHGDLWNNNIMFRYEQNTPVEIRFVDFQMFRYTPPAADVVFFLHLTTRKSFRKLYLEDILSLYYKSFSEILQVNGYDAERLLTWAEFRESYERLQDFGRIAAVICLQLCLMQAKYLIPYLSSLGKFQQLLERDRNNEVLENIRGNSTYKERYEEALEELIESTILRNLST